MLAYSCAIVTSRDRNRRGLDFRRCAGWLWTAGGIDIDVALTHVNCSDLPTGDGIGRRTFEALFNLVLTDIRCRAFAPTGLGVLRQNP
jgi:hypothetical protein